MPTPTPPPHLLLVASCLALLPTGTAALQAGPSPEEEPSEPDSVVMVDPLVVTATRLPLPAQRLGFAVSTVEAGPLAGADATEVIRRAPGAFLDESVGPGGPSIVRLRGGEEVFTQILMDGVRVNQNGGFFDFQGLALSNLGSVEVARGPQSAVYGSSAVSGVVHFLTPRGRPGPPVFRVRGEGGDAAGEGGRWRAQGSVRGGSEAMQYSAGAGASYDRGIFALPHDTRSRDGSVRLDWTPAPAWDATLTARRIETSSNLPVRDPGATRVPLDPNAFNERDRTVGGLTVRYTPSAHWTAWLRAARYDEGFLFRDEHDGVVVPDGAGFGVFDANLRFESELARTTVEAGGSLVAGPLRASYGAVLEREELEDRISGDFGDGAPQVFSRDALAGFLEAAWDLHPRLTVGGGVRVERYEGIPTEVTPRGSAVWQAEGAPLSLRVAVGRAYKAPNLQQQYQDNPFIAANPELRPERSTSVEAGATLGGTERGWEVELTLFRQGFRDLIRTVAQEGTTRQTNRNLGESRVRGMEWGASVELGAGWRVESRGAWLDTEILDNRGLSAAEFPEGGVLPFRPSVTASVTANWTRGAFHGRLTARRQGAQTVLSERFSGARVALDPFTVLDASASWRLDEGLLLYLRAGNLLDRGYRTGFDRPGMPAHGSVGIEATF